MKYVETIPKGAKMLVWKGQYLHVDRAFVEMEGLDTNQVFKAFGHYLRPVEWKGALLKCRILEEE